MKSKGKGKVWNFTAKNEFVDTDFSKIPKNDFSVFFCRTGIFRTNALIFVPKQQVCIYWRGLFFKLALSSMKPFIQYTYRWYCISNLFSFFNLFFSLFVLCFCFSKFFFILSESLFQWKASFSLILITFKSFDRGNFELDLNDSSLILA